jgi:hypothetical protein
MGFMSTFAHLKIIKQVAILRVLSLILVEEAEGSNKGSLCLTSKVDSKVKFF